MKICMLTSGHDVYDNRIYYKEVLSLKKKYDQIYIVAPGEKDFTTKDGIIVKCFPKRKSWYDRIRPMKDMFKIAKDIKADVYHAHEPDSFQVAIKLKKTINSKAVYDSHEYHPEAFAEHFKYGRNQIQKIVYIYEKKLAKQADYIVTVNQLLVDKFKKYNQNVALVPNYPVLKEKNFEKGESEVPSYVYVGGISEDRGIFEILKAIKLVNKNYKYTFIGPFKSNVVKNNVEDYVSQNLSGKNITFTGKIPHIKVFDYLRTCDAGFVLLQPNNWRYVNSEPIKIFEYMMSETAVIASDFPMMRNIVKSSNCGILVKPDRAQDIAKAIEYIGENREKARKMGINGYNKVKELYNWDKCSNNLFKAYEDLEK